jgi:hypothetical protein
MVAVIICNLFNIYDLLDYRFRNLLRYNGENIIYLSNNKIKTDDIYIDEVKNIVVYINPSFF